MNSTPKNADSKNTIKPSFFAKTSPFDTKQSRVFHRFFQVVAAGTVVAMIGIIIYYIYAFASLYNGNHNFDWLLGIFSDFVEIMSISLGESPYLVEGASYTPIAIMILYPFALICKNAIHTYSESTSDIEALTAKVVLEPSFWIALVLFFVICSLVIILITIKMYHLDARNAFKVAITILFSAPFVFAIMRGNTIYFALIFLLLFLLLYQSQYAVVREIAYLCLVLAGLIKIYPLFFGVFLLHRKKIAASFRIAIYFFALFFLSFFLFKAGWGDVSPFLQNLGNFASDEERLLGLTNLSFSSVIYKIIYLFSHNVARSAAFHGIQLGFVILLFLFCTVLAIRTKSQFSRSLIAAAIILLIPTVSYFYVLTFMLIPIMEFFKHYNSFTKAKQIRCLILFGFLFFSPLLLFGCFVPQSIVVMLLLGLECKDVIQAEGFLFAK